MRKVTVALLVFLLFISIKAFASDVDLSLESLTNLAPVVMVVKAESQVAETKMHMEKLRDFVTYKVYVEDIVKNDLGLGATKGSAFEFQTFGPAQMETGNTYVIFLKQYPSGVYGFVGGEQGVYKKEGGTVSNKVSNRGLMVGVKDAVTGEKAKKIGLKDTMTEKDQAEMGQMTGPVDINLMLKTVKAVDEIKKGEKVAK